MMIGLLSCMQAVVTLPLRSQSTGSPIQVQASRAQTGISVPGLASAVAVSKAQSSSPGSPAPNIPSPALLQGVTSQNIIKQVQTRTRLLCRCMYFTVCTFMYKNETEIFIVPTQNTTRLPLLANWV